jgi:hypothetical protein
MKPLVAGEVRAVFLRKESRGELMNPQMMKPEEKGRKATGSRVEEDGSCRTWGQLA